MPFSISSQHDRANEISARCGSKYDLKHIKVVLENSAARCVDRPVAIELNHLHCRGIRLLLDLWNSLGILCQAKPQRATPRAKVSTFQIFHMAQGVEFLRSQSLSETFDPGSGLTRDRYSNHNIQFS